MVNDLLCENNETGMFVTAFLGYLDIPSGSFTFANAGHNPPVLRVSGTCGWLEAKRGFVLGGFEGMAYTRQKVNLSPGDEVFLYTDGITEAVNKDGELFGNKKLLEKASLHSGLPLKEYIVSIKEDIDIFADSVEQADDITMLALRYIGADTEPAE